MMYEKSEVRQYMREMSAKYEDADALSELFSAIIKDAIINMDFTYPNAFLDYCYF